MAGHTPGPWDARLADQAEWLDIFDESYEIFPSLGEGGPVAITNSKANARLIAAAPDLLAAAHAAFGWLRYDSREVVENKQGRDEVIKQIGAAIIAARPAPEPVTERE